MHIYTKTGDAGETSLLGGKRVSKDCIEMDAIGEVDELNAALGLLSSHLSDNAWTEEKETIANVQHTLFALGANLASVQTELLSVPPVTDAQVHSLETWIDTMEAILPPLTQFILPAGSIAATQSFYTRGICRRAERAVVGLKKRYPNLPPTIQQYLNRLSDCLFVLGRYINYRQQIPETPWKK